MNQYIIDEEMVQCIEAWTEKYPVVSEDIASAIRSNPYNPQAEPGLWTADELIQHEKMAADAAREKVLDETWQKILSEINDRSFVDTDGDYQQCTGLSIDELEFVIKELRQSKE